MDQKKLGHLVVQLEKEESFIQKLFFQKRSFPVPKKDLSQ